VNEENAVAKHNVDGELRQENSGKNSGRIENLRPWQKGQSGNPRGRPKKTLITDAFRERLAEVDPNDPQGRTNAEIIADRMIARAKQRDRGQQDAAVIADRTEGKANQPLKIGGDVDVNTLSKEQLVEELYSLLQRGLQRSSENLGDVEP
jgi:hypothetical protein